MNEFNAKTFLICSTVFLMTNSAIAQYITSYQEIIDDLPKNTDFDYFFSLLEKAVDYCERHKSYIEINLKFGLFMIDLNLRHDLEVLQLPTEVRRRLKNIFAKNDLLTAFFYKSIQQQNMTELEREATGIFQNSSNWLRPEKFNLDLLNKTIMHSKEQLEIIYGKYEDYKLHVSVFGYDQPTPTESDDCLLELLDKGLRLQRSFPNCVADPRCIKLVAEGTDYGYSLTHRMLFMIVARFYRKCVVFDEIVDIQKINEYCMKAFNEAQYIAANHFQKLELISEHITLCGLMGHAQFFRNYWLKTIAQFQTLDGCYLQEHQNNTKKYKNLTSDELNAKRCDRHFTSVALASISSAVRYILETDPFKSS